MMIIRYNFPIFLVDTAAISKHRSCNHAKEYHWFIAVIACGTTTPHPISATEIEHRCPTKSSSRRFGTAAESSQFIVQWTETCHWKSVSVNARLSVNVTASQPYLCECVPIGLHICIISANRFKSSSGISVRIIESVWFYYCSTQPPDSVVMNMNKLCFTIVHNPAPLI